MRFPPIFFLVVLLGVCGLNSRGQNSSKKIEIDHVHVGETQIAVVRVRPGTFMMGSPLVINADDGWEPCASCPVRNDVERPVHQVTITHDFWMGEYPVTQGQWQAVMGGNPSYSRNLGPDAPVESVDFRAVQVFLAKLNATQRRWTVRLPTEAEWEYAARAGTTGETYGPLDQIAWYRANSSSSTHPVGQKAPNSFGLYDMLGNVWEWCQDWFGAYTSGAAVDPQGASTGDRRVTRGGCYYCEAVHERAGRRNRDVEDHSSRSVGFRIVTVPRN